MKREALKIITICTEFGLLLALKLKCDKKFKEKYENDDLSSVIELACKYKAIQDILPQSLLPKFSAETNLATEVVYEQAKKEVYSVLKERGEI